MRFPLQGHTTSIGRQLNNDITLSDPDISRVHTVITQEASGVTVADRSTNGTRLNGAALREAPLRDGDVLEIGPWRVLFDTAAAVSERETVVRAGPGAQQPPETFFGLIGEAPAMRKLFALIAKVAPKSETVLILGETGSGKELVARAVHDASPRAGRPFVALNCGAISPQLIESELFGHERGAFTGADRGRRGAFEQAHGGTLFLDEVGELPLELQPKLLRVLEEKRIRRVGGSEEVPVEVRVVAATHRNLPELAAAGRFREDLLFRLHVLPLSIPPLRDRGDDVIRLADFFLRQGSPSGKRYRLSPAAEAALVRHRWRGNVRELKNVLSRALVMAGEETIGPEDLSFLETEPKAGEEAADLETAELQLIRKKLEGFGWNRSAAAEALGISRSTLLRKIKQYALRPKEAG